MLSLNSYITKTVTERLHIKSDTKSVKPRPKTKDELQDIIIAELNNQGRDADLNFIDTSLITNMSELFYGLDPGNIKIDQWDVSNAVNMYNMFHRCKKFNADISSWDVSNVELMSDTFSGCWAFKQDLSGWNVKNVIWYDRTFVGKSIMPENYKPKFVYRTKEQINRIFSQRLHAKHATTPNTL